MPVSDRPEAMSYKLGCGNHGAGGCFYRSNNRSITFFFLIQPQFFTGHDRFRLAIVPILAHRSRRTRPAPFPHQRPIPEQAGHNKKLIKPVQVFVGVVPFQINMIHRLSQVSAMRCLKRLCVVTVQSALIGFSGPRCPIHEIGSPCIAPYYRNTS